MKAVAAGAFVVAIIMAAIGVQQGLTDSHEAAIPAMVLAFLALAVGVVASRE